MGHEWVSVSTCLIKQVKQVNLDMTRFLNGLDAPTQNLSIVVSCRKLPPLGGSSVVY
ncbi:hypothetical protein Hanom_Chr09g00805051 [Helianthus anomalus]